MAKAVASMSPEMRKHRYLTAAGFVIAQYLRKNFAAQRLQNFLEAYRDPSGGMSYQYSTSVTMMGETIFLLRRSPGFTEFCRRLKSRDLRAAFLEALAARLFMQGGCIIHARPESMNKGEDFDFSVVRGGEEINVEVTSLTSPVFAESTLVNTLARKKGQLPSDKPAIIVCMYPAAWFADDPTAALYVVANRFFGKSRRINAIVFLAEHWLSDEALLNGGLIVSRQEFFNGNPRHPADLTFLRQELPPVPTSVEQLLINAVPVQQESEFYRWVDACLA
ncbi:hypothetical protein [Terrihabitans soli]|uniref:hypothetical protein n=1 Tax=Terrihabitans soli TaxID=708113 RepID=UPI001CA35D41|nr:hypothetical protein [Terrihabitans soli]